ncbi:hypothetical protein A6U94_27780 [Agrobacterium tumefaciens]|nr:hypothetical protein A6U94_27780 [Agrobacterium tumefaciens]
MQYSDVLANIAKKRDIGRYLEVGVQRGINFSKIACETAIGVDPSFVIDQNIAAHKRSISLFQMPSDRFFSDVNVVEELGGHPDLIFLDGMHLFEYLLRDFANAERVASKRTLIAMHDCLPLNEIMINRNQNIAIESSVGTPYHRWWTGDVWKIVPILRKYRPDLRLVISNAQPTGLVFVTNLNPASNILHDNYLCIVDEFHNLPNTKEAISEHYARADIINCEDILANFDQSRYFIT